MMIEVYAQTDVGQVRDGNEDNFLVVKTTGENTDALPDIQKFKLNDKGLALMVSDGMGGAAAGEIASTLAVNTVMEEMCFNTPPDESEFVKRIVDALGKANEIIKNYSNLNPQTRGMGATATVAGVLKQQVFIGQIGDSRAYLIRKNQIQQLTKDQSFVHQLVEAGKITEEEAEVHPRRNIILQALGGKERLQIPITSFAFCKDDYLLICSDGLSGEIKKEEIKALVLNSQDVKKACEELVALANERGGRDNITVVLGHCIESDWRSEKKYQKSQKKKSQKKKPVDDSGQYWDSDQQNAARPITAPRFRMFATMFKILFLLGIFWIIPSGINAPKVQEIDQKLEMARIRQVKQVKVFQEISGLLPVSGKHIIDTLQAKKYLRDIKSALEKHQTEIAQNLVDSLSKMLAGCEKNLLTACKALEGKLNSVYRKLLPGLRQQIQQLEADLSGSLPAPDLAFDSLSVAEVFKELQKQLNLLFQGVYSDTKRELHDFWNEGNVTVGQKDKIEEKLEYARLAYTSMKAVDSSMKNIIAVRIQIEDKLALVDSLLQLKQTIEVLDRQIIGREKKRIRS